MPKKKEEKSNEKNNSVIEEPPIDEQEPEEPLPTASMQEIMEGVRPVIDENKVIQTIIFGSDWQEVLTTLVSEEEMDPLDIDLIKLTDFFMTYLKRIKRFLKYQQLTILKLKVHKAEEIRQRNY